MIIKSSKDGFFFLEIKKLPHVDPIMLVTTECVYKMENNKEIHTFQKKTCTEILFIWKKLCFSCYD